MADFPIDLEGTPDDVQAMVDKGSRIEGAKAYKKKWINPGLCRVWYRGKRTAPNDLIAAIKRKAGLTKPKAKRAKKTKVDHGETAPEELIFRVGDDGHPEIIDTKPKRARKAKEESVDNASTAES